MFCRIESACLTAKSWCRKLLFLHTNLSPKWNVGLPDDFDKYYTRRWEVLQPGNRDWVEFSTEHFAEDLERVRTPLPQMPLQKGTCKVS